MPVYTCNNGERTILHPTTYDVCAACFVRYPRLRVGIRVGVGAMVGDPSNGRGRTSSNRRVRRRGGRRRGPRRRSRRRGGTRSSSRPPRGACSRPACARPASGGGSRRGLASPQALLGTNAAKAPLSWGKRIATSKRAGLERWAASWATCAARETLTIRHVPAQRQPGSHH